ncbi:MAG: thioredoxin domain-containing protein [bacterium]|nr:thioredoxin domain-containing protein [bacterium]
MKNKISLPAAIVIGAIIIGGAIYYKDKNSEISGEKTEPKKEVSYLVPENAHFLGNPDAEITMVEFSDTECPFCKRFHGTMKQIMDEYGKEGKVKWVYRHFPLDALHSKSRKEAEATECAAEQGGSEKFWEFTNRIYEITPSNNGLNPNELPKIAEFIGLDGARFEECLNSGKMASKVEKDYQAGIKAGVRGTPHTIIMNSKGDQSIVNGAQPYPNVKSAIDALLAK